MHRKGYHADLVEGRVRWDLTPGAYDHWLADRSAAGSGFGEQPAIRTYDVWGELETAAAGRAAVEGVAGAPPWRP